MIKYCANATESGLPVIVIVRSVFPPSLSSQLEMRIIAPEIWRISAILVPPLPIMQPIRSFGTVISCDWVVVVWLRLFAVRNCEPAKAARAVIQYNYVTIGSPFKASKCSVHLTSLIQSNIITITFSSANVLYFNEYLKFIFKTIILENCPKLDLAEFFQFGII